MLNDMLNKALKSIKYMYKTITLFKTSGKNVLQIKLGKKKPFKQVFLTLCKEKYKNV